MTVLLILLIAACAALSAILARTGRRERGAARRQALDALGRRYGIEPMLDIGRDLNWIERAEEDSTGVRVKVRRGR